jgi:hypothetical protein
MDWIAEICAATTRLVSLEAAVSVMIKLRKEAG